MRTRIVIARKPEAAACAARERAKRDARDKGKRLDPRSLIAAEFVVLATSLSPDDHPGSDVLAFKRLKSLLRLECLPAKTEKGGRSWIYAHLILAILTDECSQDLLDSSP